jgi:hypothetical protein
MSNKINLKRRELFTKILSDGSSDIQVSQYSINPGLQSIFPFAWNICKNYTSYKFTRLAFEYVPLVGANEAGSIVLAPCYNPEKDTSQFSKQQLMAMADSVSGPLWSNDGSLKMVCSKGNLNKRKSYFVRTNPHLDSGQDVQMTDPLTFTLGLEHDSAKHVGEIWIEYNIELFTTEFDSRQDSSAYIANENAVATAPFTGVVGQAWDVDNIGMTTYNTTTITFNVPGRYMMGFGASGSSMGSYADPTFSSNVTDTQIYSLANSASTGYFSLYMVDATGISIDDPGDFTWGGPGTGTITRIHVFVYSVSWSSVSMPTSLQPLIPRPQITPVFRSNKSFRTAKAKLIIENNIKNLKANKVLLKKYLKQIEKKDMDDEVKLELLNEQNKVIDKYVDDELSEEVLIIHEDQQKLTGKMRVDGMPQSLKNMLSVEQLEALGNYYDKHPDG